MVLLRNDALHPDYSTQYLTGQKEKNRKRKEKKINALVKLYSFTYFLRLHSCLAFVGSIWVIGCVLISIFSLLLTVL